tara:strand:+ start:161 stop:733 length:573 start_codon:yes stop_codon:yes gene_type:complete
MQWNDEGFLLSKNNFDENSIIIEAFTLDHGKSRGIVYGGSSRKLKKNFQIGNKFMLDLKSRNENKLGYFNIELIKPISPLFFDDKKKSICLLSASTLLKILLPENQLNKKIYFLFEELTEKLNDQDWINYYIHWELSLIKELGFEQKKTRSAKNIKEALAFNRSIIMENFILPNRLKIPLSRNILEKYYN